ncbi:MAG: PIN domain-containing protein [Chloroflexota bacterium]|nr:PIN domain-containing protein [Chloroflexota bacterium]
MTPIFVDTSYLLALELADDQNHQVAVRHWHTLQGRRLPLVTTSSVFDEVLTFCNSRNYHTLAVEAGGKLLRGSSIRLIYVERSLFIAGWTYFMQHEDKRYSFTDCISFVLMQQMHIRSALTFDHHFAQAGFVPVP